MKNLFDLSELTPDNNANAIAHEYAENFYHKNNGTAAPDFETLEDYLFAYHVKFDKNGKIKQYDKDTPTTYSIFQDFSGLCICVDWQNFRWICQYSFDESDSPIFDVAQYDFGQFSHDLQVYDIPVFKPSPKFTANDLTSYIRHLHQHLTNLMKKCA